ncbi:MAG: hypothetical protein KGO94_11625 [Alphaproteobacteria bacterium]|nr:hypothetical protein [Alphaproteobacteria bacterium]
MKTFASVVILAVSFLSAGAFAGNPLPLQHKKPTNITIMFKDSANPNLVEISKRMCRVNNCLEA